jgi:hypothetical protein
VEQLLAEHEAGFADHGSLIWGLLSVELWYRRFIDAAPFNHDAAGAPPLARAAVTTRGGTQ